MKHGEQQAVSLSPDHYHEPPKLSLVDRSSDPSTALSRLVTLVADVERPYEDVAEQIEDKAYELCEMGKLTDVVRNLTVLTDFYESLRDKNDEQCRDLADLYLLLGQIHQFAGLFIESIQWFTKAAIVDDRYAAPFHSMAVSYVQIRQIENAIRCFEQELDIFPGNYYTYLQLADLYELQGRSDDVEDCLKRLLERNPENIQGLHSLIRHYEGSKQGINTGLLVRRLMGINRQLSRVEVVIKSYYLCREGRFREVLDFIGNWSSSGDAVTITDLVKAYAYIKLRQYKRSRQVIQNFKERNHGRMDVMLAKLKEFETLFGDRAAEKLRRKLLLSPLN